MNINELLYCISRDLTSMKYSFSIENGFAIDASKYGNEMRFINEATNTGKEKNVRFLIETNCANKIYCYFCLSLYNCSAANILHVSLLEMFMRMKNYCWIMDIN